MRLTAQENKERNARIAELLAKGIVPPVIAQRLGVHRDVVTRRVRQMRERREADTKTGATP